MKVGERLLETRSYFQKTPNPVRGPDGGTAQALCFPRGPGGSRVEEGSGGSRGRQYWVRVLAALSGPNL